MFNVSQYLERFKNLGFKEKETKRTLQEALREVLRFPIEEKDISIRESIATIKGHPALKNQIYIKQEEILSFLSKKSAGIKSVR